MSRNILAALLCWASIAVASCTEPSAPFHSPGSAPALRSIEVSGPADIPLAEGETLPPEFNTWPAIQQTTIDAGFLQGSAYATATMRHVSSNAQVTLTIKLKRDEVLVDSAHAVRANDSPLPALQQLIARASLSIARNRGYRIDAIAVFAAWNSFPIPRTGNLFTWGRTTDTETRHAVQNPCPPSGSGGGYGGGSDDDGSYDSDDQSDDGEDVPPGDEEGEYEGMCLACQQWFLLYNGDVVAEWWDCSWTDVEYCSSFSQAS